jgi:hypothetical protein
MFRSCPKTCEPRVDELHGHSNKSDRGRVTQGGARSSLTLGYNHVTPTGFSSWRDLVAGYLAGSTVMRIAAKLSALITNRPFVDRFSRSIPQYRATPSEPFASSALIDICFPWLSVIMMDSASRGICAPSLVFMNPCSRFIQLSVWWYREPIPLTARAQSHMNSFNFWSFDLANGKEIYD